MNKQRLTAILTIVGGGLILIVFLLWNTNLSVPEITSGPTAEADRTTPARPSGEVGWGNAFSVSNLQEQVPIISPSSTRP